MKAREWWLIERIMMKWRTETGDHSSVALEASPLKDKFGIHVREVLPDTVTITREELAAIQRKFKKADVLLDARALEIELFDRPVVSKKATGGGES